MNGGCEACRMESEGLPDGNFAWNVTEFEAYGPFSIEGCVLCGAVKRVWLDHPQAFKTLQNSSKPFNEVRRMDGSITVERSGQGIIRIQEGVGEGAITILLWEHEAKEVAEKIREIIGVSPVDLTLDKYTEP